MLDFKKNYFALFSLPVSFKVDTSTLIRHYRTLQQTLHPDKFASGTAQQRRLSMQAASYVNEAYQVLKNDLFRATYLLLLNGIDIGAETDTQIDPVFLMTQIEYREQLEAISACSDPFIAADTLRSVVCNDVTALRSALTEQMEDNDFEAARDTIRRWQFLDKIIGQLNELEHQLEDEHDI